ncbi:MAG: hypothetical protein JHC26_11815 [Thermofilum sp.]|jgi:hypothetical protein|uniref:hypothetical protein n=1 Tax=Thermofilum sp. TaxID=1961369 RepID=UPI00258C17C4|nr:hypothetical protein [Thermofilum sp.]MCI4409770.1 hypothetical protein [Thermofilum sp.]
MSAPSEKFKVFFGDLELDASQEAFQLLKAMTFEDNPDVKKSFDKLLDKTVEISYKFIISEIYYASVIVVKYTVNNRSLTAKLTTQMKPIFPPEYTKERYDKAQELWNLLMQALRIKIKELQEKADNCE